MFSAIKDADVNHLSHSTFIPLCNSSIGEEHQRDRKDDTSTIMSRAVIPRASVTLLQPIREDAPPFSEQAV